MLRTVLHAFDREGERYLLLVFYTLVVVVIGIEVFRRFVLSYSSVWGEEVARYSFVYLTWIGASYAVKTRTHVRVDIIFGLVPKRFHIWVYFIGDFATAIFAAIAFYYSLVPIATSLQFGSVTDGLRISRAFFLLAVPLGFAFTMLRLVQGTMRDFADWRAGREVYSGKKLFE